MTLGHLVLKGLASAQLFRTLQYGDTAGKFGEEQPLLEAAVAPAHHHNLLPLVKGSVAGGAKVDPSPDEVLFSGHPQSPIGGPSGHDYSFGAVLFAALHPYRPVITILHKGSSLLGS